MFVYPYYLYLLFLLIPSIFFILYNLKTRRLKNYSSIVFFKNKKQQNERFFYKIKHLLKFILFLIIFILIVLFIANPYIKSNKYDYLMIYIDNNKFMNVSQSLIDSIIEQYGGRDDYRDIFICDNSLIKKYGEYEFNSEKAESKINILKRLQKLLNSKKSLSYRSVLLTNRIFPKQFFTDIIGIESYIDKPIIISLSSVLCVYSDKEEIVDLIIYNDNTPIFKINTNIKQGFNYIDIKTKESFNRIVLENDTIDFKKKIKIQQRIVDNRTDNKYIKNALKILNIENDKSDIVLSIDNEKINKGIVFTQYGDEFSQIGKLYFDKSIRKIIDNGFEYLEFKKIAKRNKGKTLIFDDSGNSILSVEDNVYYLNVPLDTIYSNIVYMPGFLALIDNVINELYGYTENNNYMNIEFQMRNEILNTAPYRFINENYEKRRSIRKELLFVILLLFVLYIIV